MTDSNKDWREWAYLNAKRWPEAIPNCGPKREYGPYPWPNKSHNDPHDLDAYPNYHADAASCGETFMGDVCPYCGVPLRRDETVVLHTGTKGTFWDINENRNPVPAYHPECWTEREAERKGLDNTRLTEYVEGGG